MISTRQKNEIDFLWGVYCSSGFYSEDRDPTDTEIKDYFLFASTGVQTNSSNPLFWAQRRLNIDITEWRRDLTSGLLGIGELDEDFGKYPYWAKVRSSIYRSITPEYRKSILSKDVGTILSFTNFPDVMEVLKKHG